MTRMSAAAAILVSFLSAPPAHATDVYGAPDYVSGVWFRVAFTSERRLSYGVSAEVLPWAAGVELSPGSAVGLVRVFAGVKSNRLVPLSGGCWTFLGLDAGLAAAFGPQQRLHVGPRVGAHFRAMSMRLTEGPKVGAGASSTLAWFLGAGPLLDGGAELGVFEAPNATCDYD